MDMNEIKQLKELERRLAKWKSYKMVSFSEFSSNLEKQDSIIHNMLVAIQAAIDLGNSLIEKRGLEPPSTYAEIFSILGDGKLISKSLSREMQKLARFRNVLVHFYWNIRLRKVYHVLKTKDVVLERFYKVVKRLLVRG